MSLIRRMFNRRPQTVAVASHVKAGPSLNALAFVDVPMEQADNDQLPCERTLESRPVGEALDYPFFDAVARATGKPSRYISRSSLRPTKVGYMGIPLPVFDAVDPFYDHGRGGILGAAAEAASALVELDETTPTPAVPRHLMPKYQGSGLLLGVISSPFGSAAYSASLGFIRDHSEVGKGSVNEAFHENKQRTLFFVLYCTLPGFIQPENRTKIREAKTIADKTNSDLRLIIEADWRLATTAPGLAQKKDPLIVLMKGDSVAYLDRFDCTAKEENLAREHAVKVPGP